jgi:hypothetical protein
MSQRKVAITILLASVFLAMVVMGPAYGQYNRTTFTRGMTGLSNGTVIWKGVNVTGYSQGTTTNNYSNLSTSGETVLWSTSGAPYDDRSSLVPIGFPFQFYGNIYGSVYVTTNGQITFSSAGATNWTNTALPNSGTPNNLIALFWDDLIVMPNQTAADKISYQTLGTAPNRRLVVQYYSVSRRLSTSSYLYGQIVLYEGTNIIELLYQFGNWTGVNCTIGIENSSGTVGIDVAGSPNIATWPANNIRYTPTTTTNYIPNNASSAIPIGFTFNFYGNNYTNLYVGSNGFLSFTNSSMTSNVNGNIMTGTNPDNVVALFWEDLVCDSIPRSVVWRATTGSTGSRVFTLEFYRMRRWNGGSNTYTGQIKLYETSNRIEVQYHATAAMNNWTPATTTASIGIEDSTGANRDVVPGTPNIGTCPTTNFRWDTVALFNASSVSAVGAPVTVAPGGTFQASRSIQNTGLAAGTCSYTLRISTNTTISTADPVVYTGTTPSIAPGATNTATVTCTVSGTQAVGPYYLGLYIAGPPISTANTTNQDVIVGNFTPVAQSITVPGAVVSIPPAGGTFTATRAIQNTGTLAGTTPYGIYLSLDQTYDGADISVFSGTTASIAAGATDTQTDTCTVPGGLTAGTQYYVILYIAAGNEVSTTNQDILIGGPIFTASTITTVGAPVNIPQNGGTFQATRAIQNTGTMAGTCNYDIYISLDATIDATDTQVFSGTTASIASGATDTATDTCTVPSGLTVGNTYYVGLYIAGPPVSTAATAQTDITIVNFQPIAQTITVIGAPVNILSIGGSFQATRSIQNTGGVAGTVNYDIYLSTDQSYDAADISVYSGTTASIAAGATDTATDTCTVAAATTPGNYYVLLYLAAGNEVSTTNQDVTVLAPFNAVAQAITVQGAPVTLTQTGGTFQASRQIDNAGGDPGSASYEIFLSANATYDAADTLVFSGTTVQITGGASDIQTDTCTVPAATTPGSYYVILYISATPDETATAIQDVTINDFNPQATSVAPLNTPVRVPASQTFQATRTITNTGTAAGTVNYEIYLSTDVNITTADILVFTGTTASIAGGGTDTNSVTITVPAATAYDLDYYVGLYITSANTATSTDTVHVLPNFARFDAISVVEASTTVNINENLQVQVDVDNTGGVAGTADYSVYLSADNTIDLADRELLQHTSASIAAEGTDSEAVVVTIPGDIPAGTYWVGIYLTSANVQTMTAVSGGISITVPRDDDDDGSCGGGTGGGSLWAFLPLAMLAALCLALRRKLALER